jgi:hypothetical protein
VNVRLFGSQKHRSAGESICAGFDSGATSSTISHSAGRHDRESYLAVDITQQLEQAPGGLDMTARLDTAATSSGVAAGPIGACNSGNRHGSFTLSDRTLTPTPIARPDAPIADYRGVRGPRRCVFRGAERHNMRRRPRESAPSLCQRYPKARWNLVGAMMG